MNKRLISSLYLSLVGVALAASPKDQSMFPPVSTKDHLVIEPVTKAADAKHVVLIAGDEEYRSEEAMPLTAQLLAAQGFKCTVLFSLDKNGQGIVDPKNTSSLGHSEALDSADAIVMSIRFRNWDDESMQRFDNALNRGVSITALRTSTHAFRFKPNSKWAKYSFNAGKKTGWEKGFGRQVLGESWVRHHGKHHVQGTRSVIVEANKNNSILSGVGSIFSRTDVYGANLDDSCTVLLRGEVTESLDPNSKALDDPKKNGDKQAIAWTREYQNEGNKKNRVFTTTLGTASDLLDENFRRLIVNSVYWGLGLDVPAKANVPLPGVYKPSFFGFDEYRTGMSPRDFIVYPEVKIVPGSAPSALKVDQNDHIVLLGSGLVSRMGKFNNFETELYLRYPNKDITVRNMGDEGQTPGFRPHPGRSQEDQYAFPGAKELIDPEFIAETEPVGVFPSPDKWLERLEADTIIAFFGYNSSFAGPEGLERYKKEFSAFVRHTLQQRYNGKTPPQLAVVSPTAFQDLSKKYDTPDGKKENVNLALYTKAMREVCYENGVLFVDLFTPTEALYKDGQEYTRDGALLTNLGYEAIAPILADRVFGKITTDHSKKEAVHAAVVEKNWAWFNDFKIPNGVHVYGRRHTPYGPQNYPDELRKVREMTQIRDQALWATLKGETFDLAAADAKTHKLPAVPTNYAVSEKNGLTTYFSPEEAQKKLILPEGFKMELFASEKEFPNLANPVQLSFDNKGRLWVACMPSYPHYKIGDPLPTDKIIILEDTNGDGKADKEIVFAGDLHLPIGFELAPEGVYVSQSDSVVLLKDIDGDDKYDEKEYILSGFDDHDTHHAISAFTADPSGAILMGDGVFLHSDVETAYGPVRGTNGGFMRYSPRQRKLTRHAQLKIPNPWGIAYDKYGQDFFLQSSNTNVGWMTPGTVNPRYGVNMKTDTILTSENVRPTSGLEFVSSRHFPDEMQGDMLINNNIGFLGAKQHQMIEDGTGFTTKFRQNLFVSEDKNFRPVDLEFAPDGSLYVVDWQNVLIGHMQHNARDPHRDHVHGRIYRITYPSRPLVKPAEIAGADLDVLFENLKLPEYRSRYRTRRELRGRDVAEVLPKLKAWAAKQTDDHAKLEALWVSWGLNAIDLNLLEELLKSKDYHIRSAAVRAIRHNFDKIPNYKDLMLAAAKDENGRVRLEAITGASWLDKDTGLAVLAASKEIGIEDISRQSYDFAHATLNGISKKTPAKKLRIPKHLTEGKYRGSFKRGAEIYGRDGHCSTCHQQDGKGLPNAGFPPLAKSEWVTGSPERLIKLTLNGLMGPITVNGRAYAGNVPMTPFGGMLDDKEVADVLTFVRNSYGNKASPITREKVKEVRATVKQGFYTPEELLKAHPHMKPKK